MKNWLEQPKNMENPRNLYKVTLHIKPDFVITFYSFLKVKVQWKSIEDTFVFPKPPLSIVSFILGAICNRWKIVARPGLKPRVIHWPCEHYHWATKLPGHITNNFPPETYPGYNHVLTLIQVLVNSYCMYLYVLS